MFDSPNRSETDLIYPSRKGDSEVLFADPKRMDFGPWPFHYQPPPPPSSPQPRPSLLLLSPPNQSLGQEVAPAVPERTGTFLPLETRVLLLYFELAEDTDTH